MSSSKHKDILNIIEYNIRRFSEAKTVGQLRRKFRVENSDSRLRIVSNVRLEHFQLFHVEIYHADDFFL